MPHVTINLKALPEQRDLIDQAASVLGKSRSEFMREAACDRAQAVMLVPQNHELTTQEAAAFLNVSRPFVIKEVEAGRLKCRKVGRHRRIEFTELRRYQGAQRLESEKALQELADLSQDLRLGY